MGDENASGQPQAGEPALINPQPQAGITPQAEPQAGEPKTSLSAADYERIVAELRKENANHRTKLNKFELDEKARTEAQMTEQQKKDKQLADLQAQHEEHIRATLERTINYEVKLQAAALGVNPKRLDYVARLIEWEDIDTDDQGNPTNIKELLSKLVQDVPELLGKPAQTAPTAGGATAPERSRTSGNGEITAEYVADVMSGKINWRDLPPERRTAVLNWQAKNPYRF